MRDNQQKNIVNYRDSFLVEHTLWVSYESKSNIDIELLLSYSLTNRMLISQTFDDAHSLLLV